MRKLVLGFAVFLLAAPALAAPPSSKPTVPQSLMQVQMSFAPVVKHVAPAVVNVYARSVVQQQVNPLFNDPMFQRFFGVSPEMRQRVQQSLGSGVIVRADGLVLTNNHVVQGGTEHRGGARRQARVQGQSAACRFAHRSGGAEDRYPRRETPHHRIRRQRQAQVGDLVLAIGDPFGVGQTVTMGIVSALARTGVGASDYQFFIQTDAAVNPGNSGGALVTTDGRLAGINTAIVSRTGEYAGIGFAIPANLAKRVVEGAVSGGMKLPWIGASGQPVTPDIASTVGLSRPGGVLLKSVYGPGPAGKAGLKTGDVILSVDGTPVDDMQSLNYRVATHKPGDVVKLHVFANGKQRDVSATLILPPEDPPRQTTTIAGHNPMTGAKIENLSPATAEDFGMDSNAKGVVVVASEPGSASDGYGFQTGDIVVSVNGLAIHRVSDLSHALDAGNGAWSMVVSRGGHQMQLSVRG